jgi:hypothetical protein
MQECPLLAEEDYRPPQFFEDLLWRKQTLKMKYSAVIYDPTRTLNQPLADCSALRINLPPLGSGTVSGQESISIRSCWFSYMVLPEN